MLKKRIIPCFDIKDGRVVKGTQFLELRDAGNPVELAATYAEAGADELVFLDITATNENRKTLRTLVSEIASEINIPFTVGGGIQTLADAEMLIKSGADKVSINSAALKNPQLISEIANHFGSQAVVVAIDAKYENESWMVFANGGKKAMNIMASDWAKTAENAGAGEILLTAMNNDGMKSGFALELVNLICREVNIPIIASGGAGTMQHFSDLFLQTQATAALAASVFHYKQIEIPQLKNYLKTQNIPVR